MSAHDRQTLTVSLLALALLLTLLAGVALGRSQVTPAAHCAEDEVAMAALPGSDYMGGSPAVHCIPLDDLAEMAGFIDLTRAAGGASCLALTAGTDSALALCAEALSLPCPPSLTPVSVHRPSCQQETPAGSTIAREDR